MYYALYLRTAIVVVLVISTLKHSLPNPHFTHSQGFSRPDNTGETDIYIEYMRFRKASIVVNFRDNNIIIEAEH